MMPNCWLGFRSSRTPKRAIQFSPSWVALLMTAEFFDAEVGAIHGMRIDQDRGNARASEHGRGGRAGQTTADDRNISISHGPVFALRPLSLRRKRQTNP
jgi:hypothetical protein